LEVKHRQLARQVEVFIEHPSANSLTFFNFTSVVLIEGTTFIFGSWVCVADGAGNFRRHFIDDMKSEASVASQRNGLDEFIDNLDETLLPDITREVVEESVFNATPTRAAPVLLRSDLILSEDPRIQLPFRIHNTATIYQKAMRFKTLSALEEDLDRLL
jgi:hypothetical protein